MLIIRPFLVSDFHEAACLVERRIGMSRANDASESARTAAVNNAEQIEAGVASVRILGRRVECDGCMVGG